MQLSEEWRSLALRLLGMLFFGPLLALGAVFAIVMLFVGEVLIALQLAAACFIPAYLLFRTLPQQLRRISGSMSGEERAKLDRLRSTLAGRGSGNSFRIESNGESIQASYLPSGAGLEAAFELALESRSFAAFKVFKEGARESTLKRLGLLSEVQTGDELFDKRWFIETDYPLQTEYVLRDPHMRAAIGRLLLNNFDELEVRPKLIRARSFGRIHETGLHAVQVQRVCAELSIIAGRARAAQTSGRSFATVENNFRSISVILAAFSLAALGVSMHQSALHSVQVLDELRGFVRGALVSLPLIALFMASAVLVLRSRAKAIRKIIFAAVLAVPGMIYLGAAAYLRANAAWDDSAESVHHARVLNVRLRGAEAKVSLASWREPQGREYISLDSSIGRELEAGQSMLAISTREGYFGTPWVSSVEHMSWKSKH